MTYITILCSYCKISLGSKRGHGISGVSHGICPVCLAEQLSKITKPVKQSVEQTATLTTH